MTTSSVQNRITQRAPDGFERAANQIAIGDHPRKIRPRLKELLDLEGTYKVEPTLEEAVLGMSNERVISAYRQWVADEQARRTKFTRWALRQQLVTPADASALGKALQGHNFRFSCRYNDLLRCSETPHFDSCYNAEASNANVPVHYLLDPSVAIIYVTDKSGNFQWRTFVRLMYFRKYKYLFFNEPYGNGNTVGIVRALMQAVKEREKVALTRQWIVDFMEMEGSPPDAERISRRGDWLRRQYEDRCLRFAIPVIRTSLKADYQPYLVFASFSIYPTTLFTRRYATTYEDYSGAVSRYSTSEFGPKIRQALNTNIIYRAGVIHDPILDPHAPVIVPQPKPKKGLK